MWHSRRCNARSQARERERREIGLYTDKERERDEFRWEGDAEPAWNSLNRGEIIAVESLVENCSFSIEGFFFNMRLIVEELLKALFFMYESIAENFCRLNEFILLNLLSSIHQFIISTLTRYTNKERRVTEEKVQFLTAGVIQLIYQKRNDTFTIQKGFQLPMASPFFSRIVIITQGTQSQLQSIGM